MRERREWSLPRVYRELADPPVVRLDLALRYGAAHPFSCDLCGTGIYEGERCQSCSDGYARACAAQRRGRREP